MYQPLATDAVPLDVTTDNTASTDTANSHLQLLSDQESPTHEEVLTINKPSFCKRHLRLVALSCLLLLLVLSSMVVVIIYKRAVAVKDKSKGVKLDCGVVVGTVEDSVHVFKGIPYAYPPEGQLRWQPPKPLPTTMCWGAHVDTYEATEFKSPCVQYSGQSIIGQEDCLYLNIWTPRFGQQSRLPVLVYFHDGGLMTGSGNDEDFMASSQLAAETNAIFVSFNYRLNVFGYLSLEVLSQNASSGFSGNYGLLDQIEALRWIKKHIAAFGGDPGKVTAFGVGSGATSISALLASEGARGLFQRAWLASPSPLLENSSALSIAEAQHQSFLTSLGCGGSARHKLSCLRSTSTQHVLTALDWAAWSNPHFSGLPSPNENSTVLLTIKGNGLKLCPIDAWKRRQFTDVPLLIGSMAQEVDVAPLPPEVHTWNWTQYDEYLSQKLTFFGDFWNLDHVQSLYGHEVSPEYQLTSMVSDFRYIAPLNAVSQVAANRSKSPVYRYVSTFMPKSAVKHDKKNYAFHGMDVQAFFGSLKNADDAEAVQAYSQRIRKIVLEFAREGQLVTWARFPDSTMILSDEAKPQAGLYEQKKFDFWRSRGFFPRFAGRN